MDGNQIEIFGILQRTSQTAKLVDFESNPE